MQFIENQEDNVIERLHRDTVEAEAERIRIRREAKRLVDMEERMSTAAPPIEVVSESIYAPLGEEPPDLIPGVLPSAGTPGIVGETNVGKSLLALEIASTMVTGNPLWGAIPPTRTINRVVYFLGEHTRRTVQELYHLTGLPKEGDIRLIGPEDLAKGLGKSVVINGVLQQKVIDWFSELAQGAGLVIFDPLSAFVQGVDAENDNTVMRTLIGSLSLVAERNDGVALILSHMGKPRIDQNGVEHRRTSYAMRGASAQEDALTHVFYFRSNRAVDQQQQLFELASRKFKGQSDRGKIHLVRDPLTKRHTLLDGPRPVVQAKRVQTMDRMAELATQHPEWTKTDIVKILAMEQSVDERTIWNHIDKK
jgi:RecA-family ATPase